MQKLTSVGQNIVNNISSRYNLSQDAVIHMLVSVSNGGGTMAQFNCPELGGGGQWMQGGMTMVGDMFNNGLKNTVDNLCTELSNALANNQMFPVIAPGTPGSNQWWPQDLGSPFSSGGQNNTRYAVFPNRLAVEMNGNVTVYDTLNHNIGGVSQQQGGDNSLTFSSQFGTIAVSSLPIVSGASTPAPVQTNFLAEAPQTFVEEPREIDHSNGQAPNQQVQNQQAPAQDDLAQKAPQSQTTEELMAIIEKLAHLRDLGALTESEYNTKKTDLLARI